MKQPLAVKKRSQNSFSGSWQAERVELTEPQWEVIQPLFPPPKATGRPRQDDHLVFEGVLWVLRTGARWKDLPDHFPPYQTCHRRFQQWVRFGLLDRILQTLYENPIDRGQIKLDEWFINGSFVPAKGSAAIAYGPRGKGNKVMAIADRHGLPVALFLAAAAPHEVTLVHSTLDASFGFDHPARLIGDTAYDSEALDTELARDGIEMIARNRRNRIRTQDGQSAGLW